MPEITEYTLTERHPDKKESFQQLLKDSCEFRGICDDYEACLSAMQRWSASSHPKAKVRINEYKELCEELEREALKLHSRHVGLKSGQIDPNTT